MAEGYSETSQVEQLTFRELGSLAVTAMVERVQLNEREGLLLSQVVDDVIQRYAHKETLPVAVQDLRQFQTEANTISVKITGVPFTGPEILAFIMIADRLFDLRP